MPACLMEVTQDGSTSLHCMARLSGMLHCAKLLIVNGADINAVDFAGLTPIQVAVKCHNTPMLKLLLGFGADLHAGDNNSPPLMTAIDLGYSDVVQYLLSAGASHGVPELHRAVEKGNPQIINLLLQASPDLITKRDAMGMTVLHTAAMLGHMQGLIALLAQHLVDVTITAWDGMLTPMHCAVKNGQKAVVKLLHGKQPSLLADTSTAVGFMELAAAGQNESMLDLLYSIHRPGAVDSVLCWATANCHTNLLKSLLTFKDFKSDRQLLHAAVGHPESMQLIIQHGYWLDRRGVPAGHTPLTLAVRRGDVASAALLMEAGADHTVVVNGKRVLYYACSSLEMVQMLLSRVPTWDEASLKEAVDEAWPTEFWSDKHRSVRSPAVASLLLTELAKVSATAATSIFESSSNPNEAFVKQLLELCHRQHNEIAQLRKRLAEAVDQMAVASDSMLKARSTLQTEATTTGPANKRLRHK